MNTNLSNEYERDFYAWIMNNSKLIREGRFSEIDSENIAEELEAMGRSEKNQIISRLSVLLMHFLKWKFQPDRRSKSWKNTIREQRRMLIKLLKDNPSLKYEIEEKISRAYEDARICASNETQLLIYDLPPICPFTFSECLDEEFFPGEEII